MSYYLLPVSYTHLHKEFCAEKTQDEDYYVLTLAAIARERDGKGMNRAKVHIAAGLPLTWVATQKEDFQKYLLQNESCLLYTSSVARGMIGQNQIVVAGFRNSDDADITSDCCCVAG